MVNKLFRKRIFMTDPAYTDFIHAYPGYENTHSLDDLRLRDYARLESSGQIYLDYTGAGLYAESQVHAHHKLLDEHVFGSDDYGGFQQFTSHLGIALKIAPFMCSYRYQHTSNAGIYDSNDGLNLHLFGIGYRF